MGLQTPLDIDGDRKMGAAGIAPLTLDATQRAALQRRTLRVLAASQILAALGGSGAAAGALMAFDITGSNALASLPLALVVVGASVMVMPVSAISRRAGRRVGLTLAVSIAAVGSVLIVLAGALQSFPLLCTASIAFGAGSTAILLARYAAADLSSPAERGRAISRVVFATTFGAVAGPNLLAPAGGVANAFRLPELTGLYMFSAGAFSLGALVLFVLLRPDPLQIAVALEQRMEADNSGATVRIPLRRLLAPQAAVTGLATIVIANLVMVAVMTMAPVHMRGHGHGLEFVGFVISLHVAGMFAPSPLTGWLTDRLGSPPVAALCGFLLMIAGILSAIGGQSGFSFAFGLFLLGVGWNAGLIAGSTLLASSVPAAHRPRAEGAGDLSMGIASAIDGRGSYQSARNKMMTLDFATQLQEMKAIAGQPDFALGSVHAVTRDGVLVIASASGSQLASFAWGAAYVIFVVSTQKLVPNLEAARERIYRHSLKLEDARALSAYGEHSFVGKILEIHQERPGRIHIVFIRQPVGF